LATVTGRHYLKAIKNNRQVSYKVISYITKHSLLGVVRQNIMTQELVQCIYFLYTLKNKCSLLASMVP